VGEAVVMYEYQLIWVALEWHELISWVVEFCTVLWTSSEVQYLLLQSASKDECLRRDMWTTV